MKLSRSLIIRLFDCKGSGVTNGRKGEKPELPLPSPLPCEGLILRLARSWLAVASKHIRPYRGAFCPVLSCPYLFFERSYSPCYSAKSVFDL